MFMKYLDKFVMLSYIIIIFLSIVVFARDASEVDVRTVSGFVSFSVNTFIFISLILLAFSLMALQKLRVISAKE